MLLKNEFFKIKTVNIISKHRKKLFKSVRNKQDKQVIKKIYTNKN